MARADDRQEAVANGHSTRPARPVAAACLLHRLQAARRQEGFSRRNVARHLGITVQDVIRQECKTTDLPLSMLHEWARVLGLPVAELVEEPSESLSTPLFTRARLVRIMKTAMAILERGGDPQTKLLAQTMVDQLVGIMPELRGVIAWHSAGKRRRLDEMGSAVDRGLSDVVFMGMVD
jgi:transcriptional regulator with XRE-family HTH domain